MAGDKDMLQQVLRKLVSNAIKFTPKGGRIELGIISGVGYAAVYVQDSGVGIDADALKQLKQQQFYSTQGTASETGTGRA